MIKYFHYSTLFKRKVKVTYLQQKLYLCSPVATVAPHRWSLLQSQTHLINFPHSRICFIIIISIANKSFFQSFLSLYLTFFSLHPLMLSSFIQPQLSFLQADIIENPYSSITHTNIHTYIIYIFRISISMCKCSHDSILLYSIHVKVYCYCLTLNCYCPISNCYYPTVTVQILNCYCLPIELLLSNCYCPIFKLLLSRHLNCYCLHIELLLSTHLNCYCLLSNCYYLTLNCYCLHI